MAKSKTMSLIGFRIAQLVIIDLIFSFFLGSVGRFIGNYLSI